MPHKVIADYNATYSVEYKGRQITTDRAKSLRIPSNEIWISELWRPYEKNILFHELREIHYRGKGLDPESAHQRAIEDQLKEGKDDAEFRRMVADIEKMDRKTAEERTRRN